MLSGLGRKMKSNQFPVAKVSMESYKERKAGASQTLTGLGKWWGRKPLVMVRAALLGLLIPASNDPTKDKEIFLKLMTMDEEALWQRKDKSIPQKRIVEELKQVPPSVSRRFLDPEALTSKPRLRTDLTQEDKKELQLLVFGRMPYSEKLRYCCRPEQIDGPSPKAWHQINAHLGTNASSLPELVEELGSRRFGHRPRVGDSFCGAGSVPFEAARLGCDSYGSDLSPVAALLTWAALNIVGGEEEIAKQAQATQREIFDELDRQVIEWGIEENKLGWRADAYLYCVEVRDPESGWMVPLAPSWVIAEKYNVVAKLVPDSKNKRYEIEVHENVPDEDMKAAKEDGTVKNSRLVPPDGSASTPIEVIRRNLRMWENENLVPLPDDVFQERLYCIRWVETYLDEQGEERIRRHYRALTGEDLKREEKVLKLLRERFDGWQEKGYIPNRRIDPGYNTSQPIRERGWTHWHHLFTPRQLLIQGLLMERGFKTRDLGVKQAVQIALSAGACADWNSRLCRWISSVHHSGGIGSLAQTFYNQALNTLFNFGIRPTTVLRSTFCATPSSIEITGTSKVLPCDARAVSRQCDIWITDPPYADAINYDEIAEFFLSWYQILLEEHFPDWYGDSKRALAVKGESVSFKEAMMSAYRRLADLTPSNGLQIIMFTHQDASVWADLSLILWASGFRVVSAWCIATETAVGIKTGNYVQGTVLLVLRKRTEEEPVFLDEIAHRVEAEVKQQLDSMMALEDESDPNFDDADYQLAAYAAALRVITERPIEEIDPAKEILRVRMPGEINPVEQLIRNAVKIACDHLVPRGIERELWKSFSSMERFYLKGLEVESHGEYRSGVYQELARGFGATDYPDLLASTRANQTRLKTAGEFGRRLLSGDGFAGSMVRQVLFALYQMVKNEQTLDGLNWLRTELPDYWPSREKIIHILDYLAALGKVSGMTHWEKDAEAARLLSGAVRNDHV
jgi:adenine-specific DNA methylase